MRCLSTSSGFGWAYGFTLTPLPPQTIPQICESWLKSYLMQVCKPCWKRLQNQKFDSQQFGYWIPCWRIYEMVMMIRSILISFLDIIFYELVIVLSKLLNSCTQLLMSILLVRKQYLLSPNPYLRISMILPLHYVMGLATVVSIQLGPSHPSPNSIQLTCPYLTCISNCLQTDVLHT